MGSTFITGDCHSNYGRFTKANFPVQKQLTKDDVIIVCGDFGIWHDCEQERYNLDELSHRTFTTLFCDGNHENMDRLYSKEYIKYINGEDVSGTDRGEFPLIDMFGGKVQKIRDGVYHLLRGEVYEINGKKFFVFGGASSHDIDDGILDRANFKTDEDFYETAYIWRKTKSFFRIAHESWWKEELPSQAEMQHGLKNLKKHNFQVDYIISHCAPTSIHATMGYNEPDMLNDYLQQIADKVQFKQWFFGHYHDDKLILDKYRLMYRSIYMLDAFADEDEQPKKEVSCMNQKLQKACNEFFDTHDKCSTAELSDYLISKGAIMPPCEVGDVVYPYMHSWRNENGQEAYRITNMSITQNKKLQWTKQFRAMLLENGKTVDRQVNFSFDDVGKSILLSPKNI